MNLIKVQNELRSVPDEALVGYVQNPQPHVPSYLALSELQRRQEMREKYQGQAQQPDTSVAEDVVQKETMPQGGLAAMMGSAQPQQPMPAPEMPEETMMAQAPMQEPMMMAEGGLASLPMDDDLYPEEFAGGGMVAFAKGGSAYDYSIPMEDEEKAVQDYMSKYESLLGQNQGLTDIQDRLARQEERAQKQMDVAPWMSLARAGFAIAGGKSPFALQNIGEGAQEGIKDYALAQDRYEKANDRYLDARSKLAQADRAERAAMVSGALSAQEKAQVRNANRQIQAMEAKAAMDRTEAQNATQLKAQQIAASKKSDYETYLSLAQQDDDFYKTVKGADGKPRKVFDITKAQTTYKSLTSGGMGNLLDEDTLRREYKDYLAGKFMMSDMPQGMTYEQYKAYTTGSSGGASSINTQGWGNLKVEQPKR